MDYQISLPVKDWMPDGSQRTVVVGRYFYEQETAIGPTTPLLIPNSALGLPELAQLDPAQFSRYLIGPTTPPAGYSGGIVNY